MVSIRHHPLRQARGRAKTGRGGASVMVEFGTRLPLADADRLRDRAGLDDMSVSERIRRDVQRANKSGDAR